jgi:hypothetical protein
VDSLDMYGNVGNNGEYVRQVGNCRLFPFTRQILAFDALKMVVSMGVVRRMRC